MGELTPGDTASKEKCWHWDSALSCVDKPFGFVVPRELLVILKMHIKAKKRGEKWKRMVEVELEGK